MGSERAANEWQRVFATLVLDMEICLEPRSTMIVVAGNEGLTGNTGLVTSHFAYHIWDVEKIMQLDIYSCRCFDVQRVEQYLKSTCDIQSILYSELDRDDDEIYQGLIL